MISVAAEHADADRPAPRHRPLDRQPGDGAVRHRAGRRAARACCRSIPSGTTTITGPFSGVCSTGVRVSHYIFGGTPPYRVVVNFPDAVTLVNSVGARRNGGGFDVITNGTCFTGLTFAITDANGRTC